MAQLQAIAAKRPVVARRSVSAEAYGNWNKKQAFVPTVIAKTSEQKDRIRTKLQKLFIFSALSAKDVEVIIDAMEERKFSQGHIVIGQGDEGNELYVVESGQLTCVKQFVFYEMLNHAYSKKLDLLSS